MKVDTKLVNLALGLFPSSMNAQSPVLPPLLFQFPDNKHLGSEYVMDPYHPHGVCGQNSCFLALACLSPTC